MSKGIEKNNLPLRPNHRTDPMIQPPPKMGAKGKRYVGSTYLTIIFQ